MQSEKTFSERSDEIIAGMQKAVANLVKKSAVNDEELIIAENGIIKSVPAKELLKKLRDNQD